MTERQIKLFSDQHGINYTIIRTKIIVIEYTGITDLSYLLGKTLDDVLEWLGY